MTSSNEMPIPLAQRNEMREENSGDNAGGAVDVPTGPVSEPSAPTVPAPETAESSRNDTLKSDSIKGMGAEAAAANMFSPARKRWIVATVAFGGFLGPIATAAYYPSLPQIAEDLGTSVVALGVTITVFTLSLAFFPLFWSSFSDTYGRRWIYFSSLSTFVVGSIGCALSPNLGCLIAMRIVQAAGSSALLTVGAGTISDIYVREERGRAMSYYYLGPLMGPAISAPLGGIIAEFINWRAVFYVAAGMGATVLVVIMLILPETRQRTPGSKKKPNPFGTMVYMKHSFISLVTLNVCVVFATTFALQPMFPFLYTKYYGTNDLQNGLLYLGTSAGQITGTLLGGYLADRNVRIWKEKRGGKVMAEDRLRSTWLGSVIMPIGLIIFGWSVQNAVFIAIPIIGQVLNGYAMMSISTPCNTFFTDAVYWAPASMIAVNNMARYIIGAISPLYTPPAINALGPGIYYTIWAGLNAVAGLAIAWVVRYGTDVRLKSEPWATLEREKAEKEEKEKLAKERDAAGDEVVVVNVGTIGMSDAETSSSSTAANAVEPAAVESGSEKVAN